MTKLSTRIAIRYGAMVAILAAGIGATSVARADDEGPFAGLSGAWTGNGTVTMADGSQEKIRCRANYSVPPMGTQLNQGLNCASDSFKIEVKSNVFVSDGGALKGTWSEATHQVQGSVLGRIDGNVIQTTVEATGFVADLNVKTQGSKQTVSIQPRNADVKSVSIEMRRS